MPYESRRTADSVMRDEVVQSSHIITSARTYVQSHLQHGGGGGGGGGSVLPYRQ